MQMLTEDMARLRIQDRIREADAERLARSTRAGRAREAGGSVRRVARTVVTAMLWPIRH